MIIAEAPAGGIVYTNPAFDAIMGGKGPPTPDVDSYAAWRAWTLDGRPLPTDDYALARALRGERVAGMEVRFARWDGVEGYVRLFAGPIRDGAGRAVAAAAVLLDVTAEVEQRRQLAAHEQLRGRFLGMLGHDLRNPLSVITTSAEVLLAGQRLAADDRTKVERMERAAFRMARMIGQILDLTRSTQAEGIVLSRQRTDLGPLLRAVVDELAASHGEARVRLALAGNTVGRWDADRLAQALSNLVGNALEHGSREQAVVIRSKEALGQLRVQVHNAGPPIPAAELSTLFDPFRRRGAPARAPRGLGLGLFIAREIIRAHGGDLAIASSARRGTTVDLWLPYRAPRSHHRRPPSGS